METSGWYFVNSFAGREGVNEGLSGLYPCPTAAAALRALPNPSHTTALCKGLGSKAAAVGQG